MVERKDTDAFGLFAFVAYIGVGGFLVFAFAWSLQGAVDVQNQAICRALNPEIRGHVVAEIEAPEGAPKNLKIFLDGAPVTVAADAQTPQVFAPEGTHRLRVEAEGVAPLETDVTIGGAEEVRLGVTLAAAGGESAASVKARGPFLAPDLVLEDLAGNPVRLSEFRGRAVVLNFWATWCEPCIGEWPQVHHLAERLLGRDDVVVLAVSIDEDKAAIAPFLERMSLAETPVKVLWDSSQSVHRQFGTEKIPDTYFIDEDGQVRYAFVNVRKWGSPEAYHCVDGSVR